MDDIPVRRVAPHEAHACIEGLADVLVDCVEGGASIGFMLPIARETALAFWRRVADAVQRGDRVLLVAQRADGRIVGTVQLILDLPENQPHRADLVKMQVHRSVRGRGVAQRLLEAAEREAVREGRRVLVLDAVTGGDAWRLYQRCGWQRVGDVPDYALMPDGPPCSTTFFYKHL
ncbi:GNAT family N-acetyltransferase [Ramlibacter henchirensis]|uniref:GNAT family N-acetyltransferase n=1 Tax=Ramlibacter henchirensis TaxID=204072 RepID=A0A4Z0C5P7_9BURK|nr:GNAT family N-acetyltransferase [Ramlibacter henchirensis]TFZ07087.1 GNAT family N-acetyltransferase [Ramlibacter henchirensis]